MNIPPNPFTVKPDPVSNLVQVVGPDNYRYILRGAHNVEHAETWARRLNDVWAMGFRAGVEDARAAK